MSTSLQEQIATFQETCRQQGLRLTPQRLEIFQELARAKDHPTAEKLHQRLVARMPTLSLDTVYRTLGTLARYGLINKVETTESQAHYEVLQQPHHHLICERCGRIIDFEWPLVDRADLPDAVQKAGRFDRKSVVAYGICRHCM